MGEDIQECHFSYADFARFESRLRDETGLLREYFDRRVFEGARPRAGQEIEAWLVDEHWSPAPRNQEFLDALNDTLVVPELARFNVEFNTQPVDLTGTALRRSHQRMLETWSKAGAVAAGLGMRMLMIGILPTVEHRHLCLDNMSDRTRYRALNDQVLRLRQQAPFELHIDGRQSLHLEQPDVMLESAATSLQLHLQVGQSMAADVYNASQLVAAPMVAACCNSPYLLGRDLWAETRIPLFEQSVNTARTSVGKEIPPRVVFGNAYLRRSLLELFNENVERFPVLLPDCSDTAPEEMKHLRLHNGTIWRWNRPLIGFDPVDGPHLRIEHRVIPAGPSILDTIANSALYFGLVRGVVDRLADFTQRLDHALARHNFYAAARHGLDAELRWFDNTSGPARNLFLDQLLELAGDGLRSLAIDPDDAAAYLGVIEQRVRQDRTGSTWQRRFVARHGQDMAALTAAYWERQESGAPVCEWDL